MKDDEFERMLAKIKFKAPKPYHFNNAPEEVDLTKNR